MDRDLGMKLIKALNSRELHDALLWMLCPIQTVSTVQKEPLSNGLEELQEQQVRTLGCLTRGVHSYNNNDNFPRIFKLEIQFIMQIPFINEQFNSHSREQWYV